LVLTFLYAAMRPRFGAGPKTAVIAAVAFWSGGYVLSLIGYGMVGLYPAGLYDVGSGRTGPDDHRLPDRWRDLQGTCGLRPDSSPEPTQPAHQ
jgi:hypothetical protein